MTTTQPSGRPGYRQIRATRDAGTVTVYQAYPPQIADAAVAAGTFVPPFRRGRMTWIKPSFRWMAYRCGWARKPGQERVLAVRIGHDGLLWALRHSCLSHFDPDVHASRDEWAARVAHAPVRIQWDPERDLRHEPLDHRSVQIGLRGEAVDRYVDEWIEAVDDVTAVFHRVGDLVARGEPDRARALLPPESPYPLPDDLATSIGATPCRATSVTHQPSYDRHTSLGQRGADRHGRRTGVCDRR